MPKAIPFDGSNIVIAANQSPYLPLPARVFGDEMGTILCCWEFSPEELEMILRTKRLWSSHWSFRNPFQPMMLSVDQPVFEVVPNPRLTLFGHPAEYLGEPGEKADDPIEASDIATEWKGKGWTAPGWYFWNMDKSICFGPYDCQMNTEKDMLRYAHDVGQCNGATGNPPCPFTHDMPKPKGESEPPPESDQVKQAWQDAIAAGKRGSRPTEQ